MAEDRKTSQEPPGSFISDADIFRAVQGGQSVKLDFGQVKAWMNTWITSVASAVKLATARTIDGQAFDGTADITVIAPGTVAATSKATPVDADVLPIADSAASNVLKKLTWANLKATLKTYFDSLSTTLSNKTLASPITTGLIDNQGGQIKFPAAQSASTNANTLDDYEEGAWTPAIMFGGGSTGVTYNGSNAGSYVKVGQKITVFGTLRLSAKGSSTGTAEITGFPYSSDGSKAGGAIAFYINLSGLTGAPLIGHNVSNPDRAQFSQTGAADSAALTHAAFTNTTRVDFSMTYRAAT